MNSAISDATLDDSGDTRAPSAHGTTAHTGTIGDASQVTVSNLGAATYDNVQDFLNVFIGSAVISGGTITDSGSGQIDVAAGTGIAKITDTEITTTTFFDWNLAENITLTDSSINYIYIDYNAGSPQVVIDTVGTNFWTLDYIYVGTVWREGTTLHINSVGSQSTNFNHRVIYKSFETNGGLVQRATGIVISATNRFIEVTAGAYWSGHSRQTYPAKDTDPGGGGDTFSCWYNDGAWQEVTSQTQIDNTQYNNYGTGLATVANNRFGVHWVYSDLDGTHTQVVYGTGSYTATEALDLQPPANAPPFVTGYCFLIGKIIIERSATTMDTYSPFDTAFTGSGVPD
ncbi:MAG: hypothetical protein GY869_05220, partial [Planctomycetes bacterium]|nr:hypothetical protein [Planctomycetota bacterium]